jgi:hypothetical protein
MPTLQVKPQTRKLKHTTTKPANVGVARNRDNSCNQRGDIEGNTPTSQISDDQGDYNRTTIIDHKQQPHSKHTVHISVHTTKCTEG